MVDRDRVLTKIDELDGYLRELREIAPLNYRDFQETAIKRACERLLQISVETVLDICHLFVMGHRLGLPAQELDLFEKLDKAGHITPALKRLLKDMRGFRNILVHKYAEVDDALVYKTIQRRLGDFELFKREVLKDLKKLKK
ncbi:MAG: DUF86 domain-containing protein [Elusimicrobia bacterium]|nr:DUF86 domain-containing protein [Elusimicrobiota bacterium]MBP9127263.1 DUF86 domain-containing protein [Elusimicrobiota bacterium]MBP9699129.1 DUF86 domain-containing protein [Elusimicrobiota bacterium]